MGRYANELKTTCTTIQRNIAVAKYESLKPCQKITMPLTIQYSMALEFNKYSNEFIERKILGTGGFGQVGEAMKISDKKF